MSILTYDWIPLSTYDEDLDPRADLQRRFESVDTCHSVERCRLALRLEVDHGRCSEVDLSVEVVLGLKGGHVSSGLVVSFLTSTYPIPSSGSSNIVT